MGPTAFAKHLSGALLEAITAAALLAALIAAIGIVATSGARVVPAAEAGRYWLEVEDASFASTAVAHVYGDRSDYWVAARCHQGGELVYAEWVTADASGHAMLTLGPTERWTGGAADCTAEAGYYRNLKWHRVARTAFTAEATE